jgi:hypothetical protein
MNIIGQGTRGTVRLCQSMMWQLTNISGFKNHSAPFLFPSSPSHFPSSRLPIFTHHIRPPSPPCAIARHGASARYLHWDTTATQGRCLRHTRPLLTRGPDPPPRLQLHPKDSDPPPPPWSHPNGPAPNAPTKGPNVPCHRQRRHWRFDKGEPLPP